MLTSRYLTAFAITLATCGLTLAAPPLAKVTITPGVLINGKDIPQKTAPAWPLASNDQVTTGADPAILMIANDRVLIQPNTTLHIVERSGAVRVELSAGALCLRTRSGSSLQLFADGDELTLHSPFEGSVAHNLPPQRAAVVKAGACHFPAPGFFHNSKVVVPAAAAAAAATGAVAARVATGEAVPAASPSRP